MGQIFSTTKTNTEYVSKNKEDTKITKSNENKTESKVDKKDDKQVDNRELVDKYMKLFYQEP